MNAPTQKAHLCLKRFVCISMGTFGTLACAGLPTIYTVERPWADNEPNVSCIPAGTYTLRLRQSPMITRVTRGDYTHGWEVTGVPGRSYIMLHPANTAAELQGCIAPGLALGVVRGAWAVTSSRAAFEVVMDYLDGLVEEPRLEVMWAKWG